MSGKKLNRHGRRLGGLAGRVALTGASALAAALLATAGMAPATAGTVPATAGVTHTASRHTVSRHTVSRHAASRHTASRHAAGPRRSPASVAVPEWIHLAAGEGFTCGIREGNTLWCWGFGRAGELGTGSSAAENQPQQILKPTAGWTSVAAGGSHGCATRKDGTLWCWGSNTQGEAGIGTTISVGRPHQVTAPATDGWTSVTAGGVSTCATRSDTTLWCWGGNDEGQLGIGSTTNQDLPQQVTTPATDGWTSVAAGSAHTCATRSDTTLWCWGNNSSGQTGIGSTTNQDLPQPVTTPATDGWTSAAAGDSHTCAVRTHTLWCWGRNFYGQVGVGGVAEVQAVPVRVRVPTSRGWSEMALGGDHTCATHTGHTLWCWGHNDAGQLGIGNNNDQKRPQQVTA